MYTLKEKEEINERVRHQLNALSKKTGKEISSEFIDNFLKMNEEVLRTLTFNIEVIINKLSIDCNDKFRVTKIEEKFNKLVHLYSINSPTDIIVYNLYAITRMLIEDLND